MNEFTLEELEIIFYWGMDRLERAGLEFFKQEGHLQVYTKVESLIREHYLRETEHDTI